MQLSKRFTSREKVLLLVLALLVVAGAYFMLVFRPISENLSAIEQSKLDVEDSLTILEAKAQRLEQMRDELARVEAQGTTAEVPVYDNLRAVMLHLSGVLSSATDYDLSFQPLDTAEESGVIRRTISMSFTAPSYAQGEALVSRLHDGPYRCEIDNLAFAPVAAGDDQAANRAASLSSGGVQVTLSITYFETRG